MISYLKKTVVLTLIALVPSLNSFAIDFDQDTVDDFVLIDINRNNELEWYAIDYNDTVRRALGKFGKVGDHLAVGNWLGDSFSSKALIKKIANGDFEWDIDGGQSMIFGRYPDMVVSGLDADKNGAIDPATVSVVKRNLNWRVMSNPALNATPAVQEVSFGSKNDTPFYANFDGKGDSIATAKVSKTGALTVRYKSLNTGKVKVFSVRNFKSNIYKVLPASLSNGKDVLFVISKKGEKHKVTLIKGKKKLKTLTVKGDEFVVGKYLGSNSEVLVIRNDSTQSVFVEASGKKTVVAINLNGILVDEVNINSFDDTSKPSRPTPVPGAPPSKSNPACAGTAVSSDHLLYKPVSDTTGNVVLVFDSKYAREFAAVRLELKDGTFTEAWWKGLELWGNPDSGGLRQHWRTNVRANLVKDGALIVVDDVGQQCRFVIPGAANRRWE